MLHLSDYSLPDANLLNDVHTPFLVWIPDNYYVVLGASNDIDKAVVEDFVLEDKIKVMKRKSGGQTVLLSPNNVIISAVINDERVGKPLSIFYEFNDLIKKVLEKGGIFGSTTKGISDLSIDGKKISGSSIHRAKEKLLYHAVINFNEPVENFDKYLLHPSKEPDYRNGRTHSEFVTSLKKLGYSHSIDELRWQLENELQTFFSTQLPFEK